MLPSSKSKNAVLPRRTAAPGYIFSLAALELEKTAAEERKNVSRAKIGTVYTWRCGACSLEVEQVNAHVLD